MTSSQAMSILSSHPAMAAIGGLLAGGGALINNVISQPTLDEYGNVVETNDINPFLAAASGAVVGGLGSYGYQKLKGMQQKPQTAPNILRSSRRTPDVVNADFNDMGADDIDNYWTANSSIDPRYQPEFIQDPWNGSVNPNPARQPNPNVPQGWNENRQMLALPAGQMASNQYSVEVSPRLLNKRSVFRRQLTPIRELRESQAIDRQIEMERIKQAQADRYYQSQYGRNASDDFNSPYTV